MFAWCNQKIGSRAARARLFISPVCPPMRTWMTSCGAISSVPGSLAIISMSSALPPPKEVAPCALVKSTVASALVLEVNLSSRATPAL